MGGFQLPFNSPHAVQARQQVAQQRLSEQDANQALASDQQDSAVAGEAKDFTQRHGQFDEVLKGLQNSGYLSPNSGASSSSSSSGGGGSSVPAWGGSGGAGGAAAGTWTPTTATVSGVGAPPAPGQAGAEAFGRAKDRVGNSLTGLTKALGNNFSARNMSGGSAEVGAVGDTLLRGNQQLADVARDQAIKETDDQNDYQSMLYQGGLTQRGQDLGALDSARSAGLTARSQDLSARGQDLAAEEARASRTAASTRSNQDAVLGLWNAFSQPRTTRGLY